MRTFFLFLGTVAGATSAGAHDGGLGFLDLQATQAGTYRFSFATRGQGAQKLSPRFPTRCKPSIRPIYPLQGLLECGSSLRGATIDFHRPDGAHPMILARLREGDKTLQATTQLPEPLILPEYPHPNPGFVESLNLGFLHLLTGWDHLLFLWVLTLGVRHLKSLVLLVTAFTIGHAGSLTLAGLGILQFPATTVEFLIAFSIVLFARNALLDQPPMPPSLVIIIGLLHGLGFAGMLEQLGLQQGDLIAKLLGFNLGLELAQLVVVACIFGSFWMLARLRPHWLPLSQRLSTYTAGGFGLAWTLKRSQAILGL
ncbi:MAG TPA: hypothetical protein DEB46_13975 [Myxococcales bacterium]|nr:hypothetical protein [Myxococcales bacterium]